MNDTSLSALTITLWLRIVSPQLLWHLRRVRGIQKIFVRLLRVKSKTMSFKYSEVGANPSV